MKIYDCFTYFDEKMLLNFRLNYLNNYVDKFVISEANYTHSGKPKKLNFNINDYPKFKDKIIYIPVITKPEPAKTESANPEKSKNPTKSDQAKVIYDEMVKDPNNDRTTIIAKIKKDLVLTKAGALSYFYKFQRESGKVTEKQPSKMDKAKEVYEKMILDGKSRKDIIAAFVKEVELTPAGASTYYQNLKKLAEKPAKA